MDFLRRTWAEIDTAALIHNFEIIKELSAGAEIFAVIKADAYGHGAVQTAKLLENSGVYGFAVSNLDEALILRNAGIEEPILILGYTPCAVAAELAENNITQTVFSKEYAQQLDTFAKKNAVKIKVHIKLDTGMSRLGFDYRTDDFPGKNEMLEIIKLENLIFEGIFTHFAVADTEAAESRLFTEKQFERLKSANGILADNGISVRFMHCCNSAGTLLGKEYRLNLVRPGIILYGLSPSPDMNSLTEKLLPVMTLKSVVSMVKEIEDGDTVSYGRTYRAGHKLKIATVTAGYADGYPRRLSGKGEVLIAGKRAPIIGRICMDQLMVDISEIPNVKSGDEVILFGKDLPVDEIAEKAGTINYEIVCGITGRVPRIYK